MSMYLPMCIERRKRCVSMYLSMCIERRKRCVRMYLPCVLNGERDVCVCLCVLNGERNRCVSMYEPTFVDRTQKEWNMNVLKNGRCS